MYMHTLTYAHGSQLYTKPLETWCPAIVLVKLQIPDSLLEPPLHELYTLPLVLIADHGKYMYMYMAG